MTWQGTCWCADGIFLFTSRPNIGTLCQTFQIQATPIMPIFVTVHAVRYRAWRNSLYVTYIRWITKENTQEITHKAFVRFLSASLVRSLLCFDFIWREFYFSHAKLFINVKSHPCARIVVRHAPALCWDKLFLETIGTYLTFLSFLVGMFTKLREHSFFTHL